MILFGIVSIVCNGITAEWIAKVKYGHKVNYGQNTIYLMLLLSYIWRGSPDSAWCFFSVIWLWPSCWPFLRPDLCLKQIIIGTAACSSLPEFLTTAKEMVHSLQMKLGETKLKRGSKHCMKCFIPPRLKMSSLLLWSCWKSVSPSACPLASLSTDNFNLTVYFRGKPGASFISGLYLV